MCDKKVGFWLSEKKTKKLNFDDFKIICEKAGINLQQICLESNLYEQGDFDLILHKLTDIIAKADQHNEKSLNIIKNIQNYINTKPNISVIDPFDNVRLLLNRFKQYKLVKKAFHHIKELADAPNFTLVNLGDISLIKTNQKLLKRYNVRYPIICKPLEAHGSHRSHEMSLVFNESHLYTMAQEYHKLNGMVGDVDVDTLIKNKSEIRVKPSDAMMQQDTFVVQSFINHNAILYKIYVVGDRHFVVKRPSLKNFYAGDHETIFFKTAEVSRVDACSDLTELDDEPIGMDPDTFPLDPLAIISNDDEAAEMEWQKSGPEIYSDLDRMLTRRIIQIFRETLKLSLFGIDIIRDSRTGKYYIIDINVFPGYDGFPNFFKYLLRLLRIKLGLKKPKHPVASNKPFHSNLISAPTRRPLSKTDILQGSGDHNNPSKSANKTATIKNKLSSEVRPELNFIHIDEGSHINTNSPSTSSSSIPTSNYDYISLTNSRPKTSPSKSSDRPRNHKSSASAVPTNIIQKVPSIA